MISIYQYRPFGILFSVHRRIDYLNPHMNWKNRHHLHSRQYNHQTLLSSLNYPRTSTFSITNHGRDSGHPGANGEHTLEL